MLTLAHRAMLGAASRPKPPVSLVTVRGSGTSTDYARAVVLDSSGNRIFVGYYGGGAGGFIAKFDPSGALLWQRTLTLASSCSVSSVAVDSSGSIFVVGDGRASGSIYSAYIAKYNASGVLQWQRKLTTTVSLFPSACVIDSSGDPIFLLYADATKTYPVLVKYSTGGTLQWQRAISHSSDRILAPNGLFIDSSGALYFAAHHSITNNADTWSLAIKCSSTGSVTAAYAQRIGPISNGVGGLQVDTSGNIYLSGGTLSAGPVYRPFVCKLNSAGVVQWHRWLSGDATFQTMDSSALQLSSDGAHVYALGEKYIFKFATLDGSLAWQRSLTGPAAVYDGSKADYGSGFLHIARSLTSMPSTGMDALCAKLPDDGSGLGTYGSVIVYSESTLTSNVGSPSTATPTITDAAGSLTDAAGDMTDAAGTLTVTPYL